MAKQQESRWPIEPHTAAKHGILRRYLSRWIPIMAKWNNRIGYIDGFAGPGKYLDGEEGSPLIALGEARKFIEQKTLKPGQLTAVFVEQDLERHRMLENEVRVLQESDASYKGISVSIERSEYAATMERVWRSLEDAGAQLIPTFAFIDPCGVSGAPYEHVLKLLSFPKTEVFINLMYEEANRFLTTPEFESHLDLFFGDTSWRSLKGTSGAEERRRGMVQLYERRLRVAGAKYVQKFEMRNRQNVTDYLLFFATKSDKGLEAMKEAMWKVAPSGDFSFSDYTYAKGPMLIEPSPNYEALQEQLMRHFAGKEVSVEDVRLFVLAETSYFYYKKEALKPMEAKGCIRVLPTSGSFRRKGQFPEGVRMQFGMNPGDPPLH